jgi:hypothetical protein
MYNVDTIINFNHIAVQLFMPVFFQIKTCKIFMEIELHPSAPHSNSAICFLTSTHQSIEAIIKTLKYKTPSLITLSLNTVIGKSGCFNGSSDGGECSIGSAAGYCNVGSAGGGA